MEGLKRWWGAFKNIAIVFSFLVNLAGIVLVVVLALPATRAVFRPLPDRMEALPDGIEWQ